jgi:cysteine-rich repeat protein
VDPGEECDDGNQVPDDACSHLCALPVCGDGVVQMGEACDAGADNGPMQACLGGCVANVCGDGDVGPGEGCDDGNVMNGDECKSNCTLASCGDGEPGPGEGCDDGNDVDTDECTNACTLPVCGDGFEQAGEECDLGVDNSDAGSCTSSCKLAVCGDQLIHAGTEQCDDGADNGPGQVCLERVHAERLRRRRQGPGRAVRPRACRTATRHVPPQLQARRLRRQAGRPERDLRRRQQAQRLTAAARSATELKCGGKLYKCGNGSTTTTTARSTSRTRSARAPATTTRSRSRPALPGQNLDCKSDCYWDANSGGGEDKCEWNLKCDPENPGDGHRLRVRPRTRRCA